MNDTQTPETIEMERYTNLQAAFTKVTQEREALRVEAEAEAKKAEVLLSMVAPQLTAEQVEELETLKDIDPDAWYTKKRELEVLSTTALQETLSKAEQEARVQAELQARDALLSDFISREDTVLTPERLDELPVRLTKQLEAGEVTFEEFLVEADTYLKTGKSVATGETPPDVTPPTNTSQTSKPSEKKSMAEDAYEATVF